MLSAVELWNTARVAGKMIRMNPEERRAFETFELRVRAILPEEYQDRYEQVEPVSMGTAALVYGQDGKVAWDDVWGSFCELAMAGGPPHKGRLLQAATAEEVAAEPLLYRRVVDEICRGIRMVSDLAVMPSPVPGWVRVACDSAVTAGWLARAIVMENVSARCEGTWLDLPAGPHYRVEKEIKNVITAVAKTGHYWLEHVLAGQQKSVSDLFDAITAESPLIQPAVVGFGFEAAADVALRAKIAQKMQAATGLKPWDVPCDGWQGVICPSVKAAIWMMRGMVVSNLFARREDTVLFVPVNPISDPEGEVVARVMAKVYGFARVRGMVPGR